MPRPFDPRFGSEDDLDALLREASARRMHVLVSIPVARLSAGDGEVRFWMSRGIAGLDVGTVSTGDLAVLRGVRSAMTRFPGERALIAHAPLDPAAVKDTMRRDPITLHSIAAGGAGRTVTGAPTWWAADITSWDDAAFAWPAQTALVFDVSLLQQADGSALAHSAIARRETRRLPRLHQSARRPE